MSDYTDAFAGEAITVSSTAVGPTAATALTLTTRAAVSVLISVETNSIRVRYDGTDPTASVGHVVTAGSSMRITGQDNVAKLKMIRVSADAPVFLTYER